MLDERRLDLHRADAVAGDVENVIDASEDPEVAIVVALRPIAGEVEIWATGPLGEISLHVPLVVAPDRPQHRRPWAREREQTATDRDHVTLRVEELGGVAR